MRHEQLKGFKGSRGYADYLHCNHLKVTASSPVIWAAAKRQDAPNNNSRNDLRNELNLEVFWGFFWKGEAIFANKETGSL